jgi:tetratricopeptide (TPR) repeat protein
MKQLKKEITHYRSSRGNYQNHPVWKNFSGIENFLNLFKQVPIAQLQGMQAQLEEQIAKTPANINVNLAEQVISLLYNLGLPFQYQPYIKKADTLFERVTRLKNGDAAYMGWAFNISLQLQKLQKGYEYGKQYERLMPAITDPSFYFTMGMVSYNINNKPEAKRYLNKFLNMVQDDRKMIIQMREPIDQARKLLETMK